MVKVIIKGGVWRNTEDEILKAAVMKYGKNQWSRIASLLHRKSAKQCKARWFEWLDPSIKKTEWSREEDEKLLHLAKLMPCQWRTIAPIVGRTSTQCLERYEYLLDQAQRKVEGGDEAGPSAAVESRKIKPGEIDPAPETKPARPDPIDMDEDEIQMLAEARARLANTQGKKAKRKAREKQLDEARRLASLQKRREMRAAGLPVGLRRMRKGKMDYNLEIPFEKHAPLGFHDPNLDNLDQAQMQRRGATKMEVNYERRDRIEAQKRKEDKMKLKKRRQEEGPDSVFNKKETPDIKRSKLVLPAPQISESEIEQIVKVGRATDSVRTLAETGDEENGTATLLSEIEFTPLQGGQGQGGIMSMRTPLRTPIGGTDMVAQEAQNILALTNTQSAIKGGMNTPLVGDNMGDFSGITPQRTAAATPNVVLGTPRASIDKSGATPDSFTPAPQTPGGGTGSTPMRDSLNINQDSGFGDQKDALRMGLKLLPKAKNDFELVIPDEESTHDETDTMTVTDWIEDAAESDAREADKLREEARHDWEKQTQAVQRYLPRPTLPNTNVLMPASMMTKELTRMQLADEKMKQIMLALLHHDALLNPTDAQLGKAPETMTPECRQLCQVPKGHKVANQDRLVKYCQQHPTTEISEQTLVRTEDLLKEEMEKVQKAMQHDTLTPDAHATVWKECYEQLMFIPHSQRYTRATLVSKKDRIDSYEKELTINRDTHMTRLTKRIGKKEKRLKVLLGGYQSRAAALIRQTTELHEQIERARIAVLGAAGQRERELLAIPKRIEKLRSEVARQRERELELQKKYSDMKVKLGEARRDYHATVSSKPVHYDEA